MSTLQRQVDKGRLQIQRKRGREKVKAFGSDTGTSEKEERNREEIKKNNKLRCTC